MSLDPARTRYAPTPTGCRIDFAGTHADGFEATGRLAYVDCGDVRHMTACIVEGSGVADDCDGAITCP